MSALHRRRAPSNGFTYLGLLFVMAMLGLTAAAAGPVWRVVAQQERERELLFVGRQLQQAIERYGNQGRVGSEGPAPRWPQRLEDLLRDPRDAGTLRHLRRLYADPITGRANWGLLRTADGGIVGVYSQGAGRPLRRANFPPGLAFEQARSYAQWRFLAAGAPAALAVETPAPSAPDMSDAPAVAPQVEPDATPAPTPVAPAPRQADYRTRSAEACRRIEAYDRVLCAEQRQRFGATAGNDCDESATQRAAVCPFPDSQPLPALVIRVK